MEKLLLPYHEEGLHGCKLQMLPDLLHLRKILRGSLGLHLRLPGIFHLLSSQIYRNLR